jgi:thioredoxin reductase (NADPH)
MKRHISSLTFAFLTLASLTCASRLPAEEVYPVVVLGGGVGGLTSSLYLSRAGIPPLVIEGPKPGGAITQSPSVQNWPGEMLISGADLVDKIHQQATSSGAHFRMEEVVGVDTSSRPFTVSLRSLIDPEKTSKIKAASLIIALGSTPNFLNVAGEKEYWLKGVYNCAVCDGSLFKDKTVAVIGGSDSALIEAHYLSHIAKKVYLIVRGTSLRSIEEARKHSLLQKENVEVLYQTTVQEIKGNGERTTHLVVKNGKGRTSKVEAEGVFLAIGSTPNSKLFADSLELDEKGYIILKKDQETSIPGVYAIGDIVDPHYKQAVSAAGDGAKAALQAEKYLSSLPVSQPSSPTQKEPLASSAVADPSAIDISSTAQFEQEMKNSSTPVIVDFYATWCGPCKQISPVVDSLASTFAGKIKFMKVNIDRLSQLPASYQVQGVPTFVVFDQDGLPIDKKVGTQEIQIFSKQLEKASKKTASQLNAYLKESRSKP